MERRPLGLPARMAGLTAFAEAPAVRRSLVRLRAKRSGETSPKPWRRRGGGGRPALPEARDRNTSELRSELRALAAPIKARVECTVTSCSAAPLTRARGPH